MKQLYVNKKQAKLSYLPDLTYAWSGFGLKIMTQFLINKDKDSKHFRILKVPDILIKTKRKIDIGSRSSSG